MTLKHKGGGVYRDSRTGNLYHRPVIGGRRTTRKLAATTLTMARKEVIVLRTRQLESRLNIAVDPYAPLVTVGQLAAVWKAAGCPDRKGHARAGASLTTETAKLGRLLPFWRHRIAREITAEDCRDYHAWRTKGVKRFRLARSVDTELTTLANLLSWAVQNPRKTALTVNPLLGVRPRFDRSELVRHCTAAMPMTDEDVHRLAAYLLASDQSRPLGWQLLLEALTGARTGEILACRRDAKESGQAGYQDDHALHLARSKRGIEPWALLRVCHGHAPLAELLSAFNNWRGKWRKSVPWFIPNRTGDGPTNRRSLTIALKRACKELAIPPVISHGLRAYYVRTLRSLGIDDSEIAKRLGHRSGVQLVEQTYGVSEPGWFGSRKLDFLPEGMPPAWAKWLPKNSHKIITLENEKTNAHSRSHARGSADRLSHAVATPERRAPRHGRA